MQVTYHHGRSIDARSITEDMLNGRPVPSRTLDGFLFESIGARVTVEVAKGVRVFGGYGQDKNDRDADATDRLSFGVYTSNLFGTGIDVNVTDYRYQRGSASSYDSWYVSAGRSFGPRLYLSGEYTTSLSVLRYAREDGFLVENRPQTDRFGVSANIYRREGALAPRRRGLHARRRLQGNAFPLGALGSVLTKQARWLRPQQEPGAEDDEDGAGHALERRGAPPAVACARPPCPTASPHDPCQMMLIATWVAPRISGPRQIRVLRPDELRHHGHVEEDAPAG